ncbi:MAG: PQQ-binding-like beta-propeller repeat protein [Candidatus Thermoplasmatota archaeon]
MQKKRTILLLVLVLAQSIFLNTISADNETDVQWPMYHHDAAHQGYTTSSSPNNILKWSTEINASQILSSPAVVDGYVYFGASDGKLYCLAARNGQIIWTYTTAGAIKSSPAVVSNKVYFGSTDGVVYCLDAATGSLIWSYKTQDMIDVSSPVVAGNRVYIGSCDMQIYCLDAFDGRCIWSFQTQGVIYSSPAVVNNRVYIGSNDKNMYCLDAIGNGDGTTNTIWIYTAGHSIRTTPTIASGKVFFGCYDNHIYCVDAQGDGTGGTTLLWKYRYGDFRMRSSPAFFNDKVFVYGFDSVYCLDANGLSNGTGKLIWKTSLGTMGAPAYSSPAITNDFVYVGDSVGLKFYCLYINNGSIAWSVEKGTVYTSPAIVDGSVFFAATPQYSSRTIFYCYGRLNNAPSTPNQPNGPATGSVNTDISFTISSVMDPDGDTVEYQFDWGDGSYSFWGTDTSASHRWVQQGTYAVRIRARDKPPQHESSWSDPILIHIQTQKPKLSISCPSSIIAGGEFTVIVTADAIPVQAASVEFNNQILPTDTFGKATFTAPLVSKVTDFLISVSHPEYTASSKMVKVLKEKQRQGWIYGVVTDGTMVVSNVSIQITNEYQRWTTTTDSEGVYYRAVPPGIYTVTAIKSQYLSTSYPQIEIVENVAIDLNFNLQRIISPELPSTSTDDTKALVEKVVQTAINEGYVAAKILLFSTEEKTSPFIEYYLDEFQVKPQETDKLLSFTVAGDENSSKTFFLVFIGKNITTHPHDLIVHFDDHILEKMSIDEFLHPEQTQGVKYLILTTDEGNYVVIHVDTFSEHTITIATNLLTGITIVVLYILFSVLIGFVLICPAVLSSLYTTYLKKRR